MLVFFEWLPAIIIGILFLILGLMIVLVFCLIIVAGYHNMQKEYIERKKECIRIKK